MRAREWERAVRSIEAENAGGTHVYGRHIAMYTTSLSKGKTKEHDMAKRFRAERRSFGGIFSKLYEGSKSN